MSIYDNDPRVRLVEDHPFGDYFTVDADIQYTLTEEDPDRWLASPTPVWDEARQKWSGGKVTGPFPSRDAAIASLIGAPR